MTECFPMPFSSAMCDLGTAGCEVDHNVVSLSDPRAALAAVLSQPGGREALRELLTSDVNGAAETAYYGKPGRVGSIASWNEYARQIVSAAVDALPSGRGPADRGGAGEAGKRAT